jgi:4-amino-4-deoxy-L-arabinose transferase-like glycosyltransferase
MTSYGSYNPRAEQARWLLILALALGVRLLYIASTSPDAAIASVDAWGDHRLALNVAQGNDFSLERVPPFLPSSIRTPLYPGFLLLVRWLLGPSLRAATFAQVLLDGCTTLLTGWLATRIGGRQAGRTAALLYALNPTQVRYANELLTETLLSLLLALCAATLLQYLRATRAVQAIGPHAAGPATDRPQRRILWLAALALLTALATLCKPNVQFLPFIWAAAILFTHRHALRRACLDIALLATIVGCIQSPWIVRNRIVFGRWFLSTAFEGNISRVSAPAALAAARGQYVSPWSAGWEELFGEIVSRAAERNHWNKARNELDVRELDVANYQVYLEARQVLKQYPFAWLQSHLLGLVRYLEPQTYRACYARFIGKPWPPDILDDAVLHFVRALGRRDWDQASQIITSERWSRLNPLQRTIWWGTLADQIVGLWLCISGVLKSRAPLPWTLAVLCSIAIGLWIPGPIAYERFRIPVMSLILVFVGQANQGPGRLLRR